jgi:myosin heavy subunit
MKQFISCCLLLSFIPFHHLNAQDSLLQQLPGKYLFQVEHKSHHIEEQVNKRTGKALARFVKQEKKMQAKLWKVDSVAAKNIFTRSIDKLNSLKSGLKNKVPGNLPLGGNADLDTLQNSLKFLEGAKDMLGSSKDKLSSATKSVQDLQGKLQQAEEVKAYIREHKQQLKEQLSQYTGFSKDLQKMNKEAYYYGEQVKEYKSLLKDKKKAEAKAVELLKKVPAFNTFLQQHSQLASLFNLSSASGSTAQNLEGLQTRSQVEQLIQQRIGSSPAAQQAVSQQMEQARSQFTELKSKFPNLDNAAEMPDFKPNPMKTKSFLQRLEFGGNIQFQKSSRYFPTTSDIAGQVAYKFHKNGSAGVGVAYKLGMGNGWDHIVFSHQGLGLRSFLSWKLKGTFFINGGVEKDYLIRNWKTSALLGISKKYKINTKLKGNIILLYDFLAQRQIPQTSPVKLRIGYSL